VTPTGPTVSISARGVVSPWGSGAQAFADGLAQRRPAVAALPGTTGTRAGVVPDFDPAAVLPRTRGLREFDRTSLLVASAAALALTDDGSATTTDAAVGLVVGSTFGTIGSIMAFDLAALREGAAYASPLAFPNTVLNAPAGRIATLFGLRGVNATLSTGECSGLDALIYATEWLAARRAPCILAGSGFGVTSALAEPYPDVLGEGAAMFLLEPASRATARGARRYADVAGFSSAFLPRGRDGVAIARRAARAALAAAGATPADVDAVLTGGRSPRTQPGVEEAVLEDLGVVAAPADGLRDLLGDCLDAAGGLAVAAALEAIGRGARTVLVSAFARSGQAAFLVLGAPRC